MSLRNRRFLGLTEEESRTMSRNLLRGALLMVGALFLGSLVACSSERPLHTVKADGEWAYQHGQFDKAQTDFSEYVRRRPEAIDVRYQLAKAYLGGNQPKAAIEQLN